MLLDDTALDFVKSYPHITENPTYLKLRDVPRHGSTNTFDHSVRVAMMAHRLAPSLGVDAESAARVGLLHDFCLVDYHKDDKDSGHNGRWYCFYHPEDAVENSLAQGFRLSKKEERAIRSHMFPLSTSVPTSRLAALLTLCDKTVAMQESFAGALEGYARLRLFLSMERMKLRALRVGRVIRRNTYDRFFDTQK